MKPNQTKMAVGAVIAIVISIAVLVYFFKPTPVPEGLYKSPNVSGPIDPSKHPGLPNPNGSAPRNDTSQAP